MFYGFLVYGDNLHECHKFCKLFIDFPIDRGLKFIGSKGFVDRPIYLFEYRYDNYTSIEIGLLPCGRNEDWNDERHPYIGYENPDIILCRMRIKDKIGEVILGVEFNDAIEAGNNAWQRFPRISQASERNIPFVYVVPTCDAEIKDGDLKSLRHPNTIIQIAQLMMMHERKIPSLTVYVADAWHQTGLKISYVSPYLKDTEGEKELVEFATNLILSNIHEKDPLDKTQSHSVFNVLQSCLRKMLWQISFFAQSDFTVLKGEPSIKEPEILTGELLSYIFDKQPLKSTPFETLGSAIEKACIPFKKNISTNSKFKDKINPVMSIGSVRSKTLKLTNFQHITEEDIDKIQSVEDKAKKCKLIFLSYKQGANEIAVIYNIRAFSKLILETYNSIDHSVISYINHSEKPAIFLPIAGYVKDTGGPAFSRPDKGLVGLMRAIFGSNDYFGARIVLLYSELIPKNWKEMLKIAVRENGEGTSSKTNNLWREIAKFATCVISDIWGDAMLL